MGRLTTYINFTRNIHSNAKLQYQRQKKLPFKADRVPVNINIFLFIIYFNYIKVLFNNGTLGGTFT